jgi:Tol biopolymer transport system component
VDAAGGDPRRVTSPDSAKNEEDGSPSFLPDGRRFLFERRIRRGTSQVMLGDLDGRERALGINGYAPRYAVNHILTSSVDGAIGAIEVNPSSFAPIGTPVSLLNLSGNRGPRRAPFAVSHTGVLAFVEPTPRRSELVVVDRQGHVTPFVATPRSYGAPALSPDGRSVAVEVGEDGGGSHIWVFDSEGPSRRLTRAGRNIAPVWSPGGDAIAWTAEASADEPAHLWLQRLDSREPAADLLSRDGMLRPMSFSPGGDSIRVVSLGGRGVPRLFSVSVKDHGTADYASTAGERGGSISPDGQWFAFTATEDSHAEVFVRPAATTSHVVGVSGGGGEQPRVARVGGGVF